MVSQGFAENINITVTTPQPNNLKPNFPKPLIQIMPGLFKIIDGEMGYMPYFLVQNKTEKLQKKS